MPWGMIPWLVATGLALLAAGLAPAAAHGPSPARGPSSQVEPRFDPGAPERSPFPSDRLTVPDATQRTGLRVALPLPRCAAAPSACDEVRLLDELDGFDLSPRLTVPFSGPIDPWSVTARTMFLVRLAPGPPEATGVERLVWDPATHVLHARPERLLEPETRYGLVVTRGVRDAGGRPLRASETFHRFVRWPGGPPALRVYRQALAGLLAALDRRGVKADEVAVASVFTTGSVSTFLEQARESLDRVPRPPALMAAPEDGGRAYFPLVSLSGAVLRRQVRVDLDAEDAFRESALPLAALPRDAVGGIGVGWYWSPSYLTREVRIVEGPTGRPLVAGSVETPRPFVIVLPAGSPPPGGWPLAIFGHGYGGEMFSGAFLIAGTLARHGIATAAVTVTGHGGGLESRLVVARADGRTSSVRAPGRGIDQDGDGRIDNAEGLSPAAGSALTALGLRDGLRQQVVDLMAFVRAVRGGLDVDGDGRPDTGAGPIFYVGQSLGGIYGTAFLAVEPRVRVGVLNVPGGSVPEIARLSPVFRPRLRDALARRVPPLVNGVGEFLEDLPLRGEPVIAEPAPGALAIQEYLARTEWLGRRGDALAYARHLRTAPLPGVQPGRVLVQLALGDAVVPNPTSSALVRAGDLADLTTLLRYDRLRPGLAKEWTEPHGFLLRSLVTGPVGVLARAAQEQVARFFLADGAAAWDPSETVAALDAGTLFEVPAATLPDSLGFERPPRR